MYRMAGYKKGLEEEEEDVWHELAKEEGGDSKNIEKGAVEAMQRNWKT